MSYPSLFEQTFDVAIHGSGYAALGAVMNCVNAGKSVLLFYRRADILWESGRGFASTAGNCEDAQWSAFLKELETHHFYREGRIDSAGAEMVASHWLRSNRPQVKVLYGAWPVAAKMQGERLQEVSVATKSGERAIRAHAWIDASDEGSLWKLVVPQDLQDRRKPQFYEQRVLFGVRGLWEQEGEIGSGLTLESRLWEGEKTLCLKNDSPMTLNQLHEKALAARNHFDEPANQASLIQFSVYPIPVYAESQNDSKSSEPAQYGNLFSASSSFSKLEVCTLADRFRLGGLAVQAMQKVVSSGAATGDRIETIVNSELNPTGNNKGTENLVSEKGIRVLTWHAESRETDVLIAGAGTGGAVAALAAQRRDGEFLIVDPAPFAGGVGTGGMINGYCHGEKGGLFEQYDSWSAEIGETLDPGKIMVRGWHPEAKKIAFERVLEKIENPLLGESVVYAVEMQEGKITAVKIAVPGGVMRVRVRAVIDATGDGDVAALAGAEFAHGREVDGHPLAYSQPCLRMLGDREERHVGGGNFDAGWVDATDPEDLTRARLQGVSQYLTNHYTDQEHILIMAPVLGLRQSRNFITEKVLTVDDIVRHAPQSDSIGKTRSFLDTHTVDFQYEDDETLFWLWGCKNFRGEVYADMPYRMLIPKRLRNLWLACRATGVSVPAAYAVRMQRDVQRMGEVAGYAAVEAVRSGLDALQVGPDVWRPLLLETGAYTENSEVEHRHASIHVYDTEDPIGELDKGVPCGYLWFLYKDRARYEQAVIERLHASDSNVSWLAAVVLAMWGDARAEDRLLKAIETDELGVETPKWGAGAFMQWVDIPNWLLAVNLLRCCGTGKALQGLRKVAAMESPLLDIRTAVAITISRIAPRLTGDQKQEAAEILKLLLAEPLPEGFLPPSRSLYRSLRGEPQVVLKNTIGLDTREDHAWRLPFVIAKASKALGVAVEVDISDGLNDERALVRRAFRERIG